MAQGYDFEYFLDLIEERPCLYKKRDADYKDSIMTQNCWYEVAFILGESVEVCKKRWASLKELYNKEQMSQSNESRSGSGASKRNVWEYYKRMHNMLQDDTPRETHSNLNKEKKHMASGKENKRTSSKAKQSKDSPVDSAIHNINNILLEVSNKVKDSSTKLTENDPDVLAGQLVCAELNQLSPLKAKKIKKKIMMCLYQDSDSD